MGDSGAPGGCRDTAVCGAFADPALVSGFAGGVRLLLIGWF
ncbi:hypothetical protein [Streptomyces mirabilis]